MSFRKSFLSYPSCQMVNLNYSAYWLWCQSCQFFEFLLVNCILDFGFRDFINQFVHCQCQLQYQWIYSISIFNCTWIQSFLLRRYQEHMIHSYFIVTYLSSVERHRQVLYIIYFSTQALDVCLFASGLEARGGVCILRGSCNLWGL